MDASVNFDGNANFELINKKKTIKNFSWKGRINVTNKTKNIKIYLDSMIDKNNLVIDMNITKNKNKTVNWHGTIQNKGHTTNINMDNINIKNKSDMQKLGNALAMAIY